MIKSSVLEYLINSKVLEVSFVILLPFLRSLFTRKRY